MAKTEKNVENLWKLCNKYSFSVGINRIPNPILFFVEAIYLTFPLLFMYVMTNEQRVACSLRCRHTHFQTPIFTSRSTFFGKTSHDFHSPGHRIVRKLCYYPILAGVDLDFGVYFRTLFHDFITLDSQLERPIGTEYITLG